MDGLIRLVNAQLLYCFCRRFVDPGELNTLVFLQDERLVVGVIVGDAVLRHSHVLIMREDTRCVERRRDLDFSLFADAPHCCRTRPRRCLIEACLVIGVWLADLRLGIEGQCVKKS